MANQTIDIPDLTTGQSGLTVNLVDADDDSLIASDQALTEQTNAKTHYRCTINTTATDWHFLPVKDSDGTVIGSWAVKLTNTASVHLARDIVGVDWRAIRNEDATQDLSGTTVGGLAAAERTAIANALFDLLDAIDGKTLRQVMRYLSAVIAGKIANANQDTETFLGLDGTTERVQFQVDSSGNRTSVTYDP